jgi:iron-sulfur cluster insertion protein
MSKDHVFKIDDSAAKALSEKFKTHSEPDKVAFRIAISGGGCSGFQYEFSLDTTIDPEIDLVFEHHGVKVVIDEDSMEFMEGSTLKFQNDFGGSFFKVDNPNAVSGCGCGTSFSI